MTAFACFIFTPLSLDESNLLGIYKFGDSLFICRNYFTLLSTNFENIKIYNKTIICPVIK